MTMKNVIKNAFTAFLSSLRLAACNQNTRQSAIDAKLAIDSAGPAAYSSGSGFKAANIKEEILYQRNPDVIYLMPFFNTKDVGPVALEIPPADSVVFNGSIMTC